ncbi:hypothetical protein [Tropicibacter sp. S64]|uniref:hypothetical protein n=1 Tax=Tropicibacter sp. S64 TaxID=3415122 RepID=UPI003C7A3AC5
MLTRLAALITCIALPTLAPAQQVMECDWQASARNLPEPWEAYTRTFSNGAVRLAMLDTIEPAAGWAYLLILSPPHNELGDRQCRVVGLNGMGFAGMTFDALQADYDPAQGLIFTLPVSLPGGGDQFVDTALRIVLNQATGQIDAWLLN